MEIARSKGDETGTMQYLTQVCTMLYSGVSNATVNAVGWVYQQNRFDAGIITLANKTLEGLLAGGVYRADPKNHVYSWIL
jgi:hypothetical protein